MSLNKKLDHSLVFIPMWMKQVQKTYDVADSGLLSLASLLDILSVEDVAFYYAANLILFKRDEISAITDTFKPFDLVKSDSLIIEGSLSEDNKASYEKRLQDVINLANYYCGMFESQGIYTNSMENIIRTLQYPPSQRNVTATNFGDTLRDNYVFELLPIDGRNFGITFIYGEGNKSVNECLEQSIELLSTIYPFTTVCQTPLFNTWVQTLK